MAFDLSAIKRGPRLKAPKVVLYGVGGIGKTTWAAGAPNPIFLFTEEGQGALDVARFEPRPSDPVLQTWEELMAAVQLLYNEKHDYRTVVIDTLDFAEPLLWKYTAEKHGKNTIEDWGFGKGYVFAVDEARTLLAWLDALRNHKGMAIVILAHSETKRFESPDAESYDRYKLRLQDRFAALVHDWSDALLFANYKSDVVRDKEAFNQERRRAVGLGQRVVYCEERPAFWAKNRYGLPPEIDLNWSAFQRGIVVPPQRSEPQPEKKQAAAPAAEEQK